MSETSSSWGRLHSARHHEVWLGERDTLAAQMQGSAPGIAFGMGRSYGDQCMNDGGTLWHTTGLDRLIRFDETHGRLVCEAGVLLRDIQHLLIPRGWSLPVTPGTELITVGGAIANDVHGKNHHVCGSFGDHVLRLELVRCDGQIIDCGPGHNTDWFCATVGGMGLTGLISRAELQLAPVAGPWLETETLPYESLEQFFQLADQSESEWQHTVSWIDCLNRRGRGLFLRANPAAGAYAGKAVPRGRNLDMPLTPPFSLVNRLSLKPFNLAYYQLKRRQTGRKLAHYRQFLYPLDNLSNWNRMYGPRGFYQYQSVLPRTDGAEAVGAMLDEIGRSGQGSFLAVLKTFGERQAIGMMSFPQPGVTLALDFPNQGRDTLKLFDRLDAIVRQARGRLYCAKDARMPPALFEAGYPRLAEFLPYRDPGISSALSRRLLGQ